MDHHFNVEVAIERGVSEAVVIHNIAYWMDNTEGNNKHFYDGHWWTYNSCRAFAKLFPYFSQSQIKRLLLKLEKSGVIKSGNYNKNKYDQTKWYTICDEWTRSISLLHLTKSSNRKNQIGQPIPDIKPDIKPNNNTIVQTKESAPYMVSQFDKLWSEYPSKLGKKEAFRHFKSSVRTENNLKDIRKALDNYKQSKSVNDGFIQNGKTWFNNWQDWIDYEDPNGKDVGKSKEWLELEQLVKDGK